MDISTSYMGKRIKNPIIIGSSGLTSHIDTLKKCEDYGAGAVILKSLFEEQILADKKVLMQQDEMYFWYPEAVEYVDNFSKEQGVEAYIKLVEDAKKALDIPVIASVNCVSPKIWPEFSAHIQKAGADGIELNIFVPPSNINTTSNQIENLYMEIVDEVGKNVSIPISVKVGMYFTNLAQTLFKLSNTSIDSLVLFNRYYRPDIDIANFRVVPGNILSTPEEITLCIRWTALLSNKLNCNLVSSTGIHDYEAVIKQILCGASAVQLCSILYKNGLEHIEVILKDLEKWMSSKNYLTLANIKGKMAGDEEIRNAFDRVQFMKKSTGEIKP